MISDHQIQQDVMLGLEREPRFKDGDIVIAVRAGIVTLAGFTRCNTDRWLAEYVAGTVKGVRGITNDLAVRLPPARSSEPTLAYNRGATG